MNAFEAYCEYTALKNHFSERGYDYFKYNGKVKLSAANFSARSDRYYFEKLAKKLDTKNFIIANIIANPKIWIGELVTSDECNRIYAAWAKRNQALTYTFTNELGELDVPFKSNFVSTSGHPPLFKLLLRNKICIETFCILLSITGVLKDWNTNMEYDPVWSNYSNLVSKYTGFIKYDKSKYIKILCEHY